MNSIICTPYVIHLGNPKLYKELLKIVLQQKKNGKTFSAKFYNSLHSRACNQWYIILATFFISKNYAFWISGRNLPKSFFSLCIWYRLLHLKPATCFRVMSVTGWRQLSWLVVLHIQCATLAETRFLNFRFR